MFLIYKTKNKFSVFAIAFPQQNSSQSQKSLWIFTALIQEYLVCNLIRAVWSKSDLTYPNLELRSAIDKLEEH